MRRLRYVVPLAALLLTTASCATSDPAPADPSPSPSPTATPDASETPAGGTAEEPVVLEPVTDLLDWQPLAGPIDDTVISNSRATLTLDEGGTRARLGGAVSRTFEATGRERISDGFLDGDHAVVVLQDTQETRPARALVIELASGDELSVDGRSEVPTTTGGTWALGEGRLLHATVSKGSYCLAEVDLASERSRLGWCAPQRHGFNGTQITPAGVALMTFDDAQPSCRTVVAVTGAQVKPFPGVTRCKGWEGLLADSGAVWSVVPKQNRIEAAHFFAREDDAYFDLGPGTSGTLTWCTGAAYFVRDPQRERDPARLMRWTATDGLQTVYESPAGPAFLAAPRCGGDTMNLTALSESGDEQVSAFLG